MFYKFCPVKLWARLRFHSPSDVLRGILQKVFPFKEMFVAMPDSEMIEDTAYFVNEAINDKVQVDLIINNRGGRDITLIARKITDRFNSENKPRPF